MKALLSFLVFRLCIMVHNFTFMHMISAQSMYMFNCKHGNLEDFELGIMHANHEELPSFYFSSPHIPSMARNEVCRSIRRYSITKFHCQTTNQILRLLLNVFATYVGLQFLLFSVNDPYSEGILLYWQCTDSIVNSVYFQYAYVPTTNFSSVITF